MKEDRKPNDVQRKQDFEESAFQQQPHRGAWTGGWKDLPGQATWLEAARRTEIEDDGAQRPPVERERPDDEVLEDVRGALEQVDGAVHVKVAHGNVLLAGRVASQASKLEAQRIAGAVAGVRELYNRLDVGPAED